MATNALELEVGRMHAAAEEATGLLRALANSDRLLLLCRLSQGECCVSELEEELGIQQPTLSQQLTVLRAQELVCTRRDGKRIYYSVSDPNALAVLETLYRLFCAPRAKGNCAPRAKGNCAPRAKGNCAPRAKGEGKGGRRAH